MSGEDSLKWLGSTTSGYAFCYLRGLNKLSAGLWKYDGTLVVFEVDSYLYDPKELFCSRAEKCSE